MFNAGKLIQKVVLVPFEKEEPDKQGLSGSDESFQLVTTSRRNFIWPERAPE
jgi:hypothetical protein